MRQLLVAAGPAGTVVALVLLAGCGTTGGGVGTEPSGTTSASDPPAASPAASEQVGKCGPDDPAVTSARVLPRVREGVPRETSTPSMVQVDLDGDGRSDRTSQTAADAAGCPSTLFAEVAGGFLVAEPVQGPAITEAYAVRLPGTDADLLVTQQRHPRGGSQTRVYAAADGALSELQDADGNAIVPFVATDTPPAPLSVTCTDDGIAVTEAVAHEPAGVMFTWDVRRTTYAVTDGRAERTDRREVADNVLPGQLRKRFPKLARAEVLADCRS